ncbi:MAG: (d)CMP kinase [Marinifilaceae bacterium]|jgi:cytidylate kinase|nr:(d)CMP kinase [Marinifilaceae bacterium]
MTKKIVIAIDGHSSCGKSTVAKQLSKSLAYSYIDTGAMYRAATLYAIRNGLFKEDKLDENLLISKLDEIKIDFKYDTEGKQLTILNGEIVEDEIRTMFVSDKVSHVAKLKELRAKLVDIQRELSLKGGVIMDGRDIGSVVLPNADLKIFMTTSPEIRAKRRYNELSEKGENVDFDSVLENIKKRDYLDENREESPLIKAKDAIVLDNGNMTKEEQLEFLMSKIKSILN